MLFELPHIGQVIIKPLIFDIDKPLMKSGQKYFKQEDYQSSLSAYKKSLNQEGDNKETRNNIACCMLLLSDHYKSYRILKSLKTFSKVCIFNQALASCKTTSLSSGLKAANSLKESPKVLLLKAILHHQLSNPIKSFKYINKYLRSEDSAEIHSILKKSKQNNEETTMNRGREKISKSVKGYLHKFLSKSNQSLPFLPAHKDSFEDEGGFETSIFVKRKSTKGQFSNTMIFKNTRHILTRIINPPQNRIKAQSPIGLPGFNCKDVMLNNKILEVTDYRAPKTPVFTNHIDLEVDFEIDRYKQVATQSLFYISSELNEEDKNIEGLYLLLRNLKFFKKHKSKIVKEFIKVARYEKYPVGSVILQEGEPGVHVFIIISGSVIVTKQSCGNNIVIASAYDGDVIGEYAFIRNFKAFGPALRTATCTTTEESHLIRINNSDMTDIIERHSDENNDYLQFIKSLQAFENITPVDLALLSNTMTTRQYEMDACILKAGEIPECLFFVYRGRVKIKYPAKQAMYSKVLKTVKHSTITKELTFGSGNYFGQRTLLGKKIPANYPIYADSISFTTLLFILKEDFEQLFKPIQMQILQNLAKSPEFDLKVPEAYSYL